MTTQLTRTSKAGQALAGADAAKLAAVLDSALAPNTRRAYRAAAERCAAWLADRDLALTDAGLAAYVADLADQGRAPATIKLAASAVGAVARAQGLDDPRGELTRQAVKGATRANRDRGRGQVQGLDREDLEVAARLAAADGSAAGLRDAAMLRLGSDGLLRIGELAAVQVGDLEDDAADGSARLRLAASKTDQAGEGAVLYVGAETVRAIRAWQRAASIVDGPLFRRLSRAGNVIGDQALTPNAARAIVARRAAAAGVEGRVSGHSLRVGSAQSLVRAGADLPELMQAGRWRDSATAAGYAAGELAGRGAVARFFYGAGK